RFLEMGIAAGVAFPALSSRAFAAAAATYPAPVNPKFPAGALSETKESVATSYNNFYEFSLEKGEVKDKVSNWHLEPASWRIEVG
ncbi:hypothetical protein, partial [Streptococcus suis]|uniref:hypothetical protein n=1 Tax=Streptococcus suis TaxID=1307 RepID=UPI0037BBA89D